jgi:hypothetical protein
VKEYRYCWRFIRWLLLLSPSKLDRFHFISIRILNIMLPMEQHALKNVNSCLNTDIYSCLETSNGESCNLHLNMVHFSTPVLIRHLWQLKTAVFSHRGIIRAVLLFEYQHLLLIRDIWWSSTNLYLNLVHFFNTNVN